MKLLISLSQSFESVLLSHGVPKDVVSALLKAMEEAENGNDSAKAYGRAMPRAFAEYGTDGLKTQIMYLLLYLKHWKGEEAITSKKILNRYANK